MTEAEKIAASLTEAEGAFLARVCGGEKLGCADRQEDRARQRCRRLGLAHVVQNPRRWEPLPLGEQVRSILQSEGTRHDR